MKICPVCNKEFNDDAQFCNNDGTRLIAKSEIVEHDKKDQDNKPKSKVFPERVFLLVTNIFTIIISVIGIASIFGDWIGYPFSYGYNEGIADLAVKGYDSGNVINMINILLRSESGIWLKSYCIVALILMLVFVSLSVFLIFIAIKSITTGKSDLKQKISLVVFIALALLTGLFVNPSNRIMSVLIGLSILYAMFYLVYRIVNSEGKLSRVLFGIASFALLFGFLLGINASASVVYRIVVDVDYTYVDMYSKDGLFGFLYILISINNGAYAGDVIPQIYYLSFAIYIIVVVSLTIMFVFYAFEKYDKVKYIGFAICLLLIVWMIESSILDQHALDLGRQIASFIFLLIGTVLLTTSQALNKKDVKNIAQE